MDVFTFACIFIVTSILAGCYKATLKHHRSEGGSEIRKALASIVDRLDQIERRTSDLETLMIEREKELKYDRL